MSFAGRDDELLGARIHRRWRAEDLEQRALENARALWMRNVEQNRRDCVRAPSSWAGRASGRCQGLSVQPGARHSSLRAARGAHTVGTAGRAPSVQRHAWRLSRSARAQAERAQQLKYLSKLAALVAGFAMASFLQFNFQPSTVQRGVLTCYAIVTSAVVSPERA